MTAPRVVAITARHPHQRAAAERLGVTVLDEADAIPWGKQHRPDVVIESVGGAADTVADAIRVIGRGGRLVLLGTFNGPKPVDLQRLMMKEVALLGSFCYGSGERETEFATAARLTGRWQDELARADHAPIPARRGVSCVRDRRRQDDGRHQGHPDALSAAASMA